MSKRKTTEEFINELYKIRNDYEVIGEYLSAKELIEIRCRTCGNIYMVYPTNLYRKERCKCQKCNPKSLSYRKTNESFVGELKLINPTIVPLEKYVTGNTPILCKCSVCKNEWKVAPNSLISNKTGCPKCAGKKKKTLESLAEELKEDNPYVSVIDETYVNAKTPLLCKCNICKSVWKASATNLLRGRRCPKCFGKNKYSLEHFKGKLNSINSSIEVISDEYINNRTKLKCKCKLCGNIWEATPSHLLNGTACPECENFNTSYVEKYIYYSFVFAMGEENVVSRDRKAIGRELDIYIPSLKLAIEPGDWKWHKNKFKSDMDKLKLCEEKGIRLLIIYDSCVEFFDSDSVISYAEDLGQRKNESILQELILDIFKQYNLSKARISPSWSEISQLAYKSSRRVGTEEFKNKLFVVNPNIEVVGEYTRAQDKIEVRCRKHNVIWRSTPNNLLGGKGCRLCMSEKISKSRSKKVICVETGEVFASTYDAASSIGVRQSNISACCCGKQKTSGGYHWKYQV